MGGTAALVGGKRTPFFPPAGFKGFSCPALVHLVYFNRKTSVSISIWR